MTVQKPVENVDNFLQSLLLRSFMSSEKRFTEQDYVESAGVSAGRPDKIIVHFFLDLNGFGRTPEEGDGREKSYNNLQYFCGRRGGSPCCGTENYLT